MISKMLSIHNRRLRVRGPLVVIATSLGLVVAAPAVLAQDDPAASGGVTVLQIDTREGIETGVDPVAYIRTDEVPDDVTVSVNGQAATAGSPIPAAAAGVSQQTVLVIDTSEVTERDDLLPDLVSAALDYVEGAPANEELALVTAGGSARLQLGLTLNRERLSEEISSLEGAGRTALFDAMSMAIDQFEDADLSVVRNIVMLGATPDDNSSVTPASVRGDALSENVTVFSVSLGAADGPLERISSTTGGRYTVAADGAAVADAVTSFSNAVANTYVVEFTSAEVANGGSLVLTVDGAVSEVSFVAGSVSHGAALDVPPAPGGPGWLEDKLGLTIGIALAFVAASLAAYAVASLMRPEVDALGDLLSNYSGAASAKASGDTEVAREKGFRGNALFQRAVSITNQFAEDKGFLPRIEAKLEQSDVPLRAAEAMTFYVGGLGAGAVVGLLLGRSMIAALIGLILAAVFPPLFLSFKAKRRFKKFVSQLPDTLQLLSSTLKAGYSFMQGVEAVSKEITDPMGAELRRVVTEAQLGRAVEDALDASAERMASDDFGWAVMAVRIQREVGGNLAELLLTVAETMTARERLRREVSALTAEGRMSAIILGALPVGLAVIMYVLNPTYTGLLFSHSLGRIMLGVAIVAALIGFVWMKKIIDIKI